MGAEEGPRLISPLMKNEEYAQDQACCSSRVIPLQFFAEIGDGEHREHRQCNHFLNGFELRGIEFVGADAICRHLETIFEKRDTPTGEDHFPKSFAAVLQVAVPREGHEDV